MARNQLWFDTSCSNLPSVDMTIVSDPDFYQKYAKQAMLGTEISAQPTDLAFELALYVPQSPLESSCSPLPCTALLVLDVAIQDA